MAAKVKVYVDENEIDDSDNVRFEIERINKQGKTEQLQSRTIVNWRDLNNAINTVLQENPEVESPDDVEREVLLWNEDTSSYDDKNESLAKKADAFKSAITPFVLDNDGERIANPNYGDFADYFGESGISPRGKKISDKLANIFFGNDYYSRKDLDDIYRPFVDHSRLPVSDVQNSRYDKRREFIALLPKVLTEDTFKMLHDKDQKNIMASLYRLVNVNPALAEQVTNELIDAQQDAKEEGYDLPLQSMFDIMFKSIDELSLFDKSPHLNAAIDDAYKYIYNPLASLRKQKGSESYAKFMNDIKKYNFDKDAFPKLTSETDDDEINTFMTSLFNVQDVPNAKYSKTAREKYNELTAKKRATLDKRREDVLKTVMAPIEKFVTFMNDNKNSGTLTHAERRSVAKMFTKYLTDLYETYSDFSTGAHTYDPDKYLWNDIRDELEDLFDSRAINQDIKNRLSQAKSKKLKELGGSIDVPYYPYLKNETDIENKLKLIKYEYAIDNIRNFILKYEEENGVKPPEEELKEYLVNDLLPAMKEHNFKKDFVASIGRNIQHLDPDVIKSSKEFKDRLDEERASTLFFEDDPPEEIKKKQRKYMLDYLQYLDSAIGRKYDTDFSTAAQRVKDMIYDDDGNKAHLEMVPFGDPVPVLDEEGKRTFDSEGNLITKQLMRPSVITADKEATEFVNDIFNHGSHAKDLQSKRVLDAIEKDKLDQMFTTQWRQATPRRDLNDTDIRSAYQIKYDKKLAEAERKRAEAERRSNMTYEERYQEALDKAEKKRQKLYDNKRAERARNLFENTEYAQNLFDQFMDVYGDLPITTMDIAHEDGTPWTYNDLVGAFNNMGRSDFREFFNITGDDFDKVRKETKDASRGRKEIPASLRNDYADALCKYKDAKVIQGSMKAPTLTREQINDVLRNEYSNYNPNMDNEAEDVLIKKLEADTRDPHNDANVKNKARSIVNALQDRQNLRSSLKKFVTDRLTNSSLDDPAVDLFEGVFDYLTLPKKKDFVAGEYKEDLSKVPGYDLYADPNELLQHLTTNQKAYADRLISDDLVNRVIEKQNALQQSRVDELQHAIDKNQEIIDKYLEQLAQYENYDEDANNELLEELRDRYRSYVVKTNVKHARNPVDILKAVSPTFDQVLLQNYKDQKRLDDIRNAPGKSHYDIQDKPIPILSETQEARENNLYYNVFEEGPNGYTATPIYNEEAQINGYVPICDIASMSVLDPEEEDSLAALDELGLSFTDEDKDNMIIFSDLTYDSLTL